MRRSRRELLTAFASLTATAAASKACAASDEYRFGLTPVFLTSDQELLSRLRAYLERKLDRRVRLVSRRTYQEITALLLSGQVDAAWICGYPYVVSRAHLALVSVPVWQQRPLYRSYLICERNRTASSLEDLGGDVHAFSDPDSNSGWLVTAAALAREGKTPDRFFAQSIFTYGHRNVIRAVGAGLAQSGSVDGYVYEVMRDLEPDLIGATRIVERSAQLGFPPIACTAAAAASPLTLRLQTALRQMPDDEDGQSVLTMLRLDGFSLQQSSLYDTIAEEVSVVRGLNR
ncbi:PhnD/SsuA/transferrin family substrate-binding protein [Methylobacterium nonmethylotrophicum]|uniref:Phosphonate ABC transporter substrate-binding protein n=1 Tax=Methylobacterium nonmethylotrophicum TaxID=1141884 RepID=A0A4Z0NG15_9HYPH|nr:PhnD/SsuA/transferrin family substrate-binding protein [Methylobacterium nonmethylotrophicum]TGD94561.1 phosphonate ABC transporter substrate-binding protein [Methylobacterium nonmethylotrophicum]